METSPYIQTKKEIYAKLHEAEQQTVASAKRYTIKEILKKLHLSTQR
jgi:hypothetical protein